MKAQPIAIVGMACRFPGQVSDPTSYWRMLRDRRHGIREVDGRWNADAFYGGRAAVPGKMTTRHAALLDDVSLFDAEFFGISEREALDTDPQHRVALEVAWEAFEDAGLPLEAIRGTLT